MKKKVFSIQYSVFSSVKRGALSRAELSREASAAVLPLPGGEGRPARHSAFDEGRGEGELFPNCIVPADGERKFNSQLTKSESMSNVSPPSAFGLLSDFGLRISAFLRHSSLLRRSAFSLIEILVAVALMSFIVLGLLITFNHVSRVFRSGMGQVDFMASGRTVTENIMRELEQMTPSSAPYTINFLADQPRITPSPSFFTQPLIQALPGTTSQRVNSIQELFFFTKFNQDWLATGYKVLPNPGSDCVGSLYRYTATNRFNLPSLTTAFLAAQKTNLSLVADGVVNFRITAFATNGFRILPNPGLPAK